MFSFGFLIAFQDLLAASPALVPAIIISVVMVGMRSQLPDGSSISIVTTCFLQIAGYVIKGMVDVAKASREQILTFYHNFHAISKRHFLQSSLCALQLINSSYLSCALAFLPALVQSHFQH